MKKLDKKYLKRKADLTSDCFLEIFELLEKNKQMTLTEIKTKRNKAGSTNYEQLDIMLNLGLVDKTKIDGKQKVYSLTKTGIKYSVKAKKLKKLKKEIRELEKRLKI